MRTGNSPAWAEPFQLTHAAGAFTVVNSAFAYMPKALLRKLPGKLKIKVGFDSIMKELSVKSGKWSRGAQKNYDAMCAICESMGYDTDWPENKQIEAFWPLWACGESLWQDAIVKCPLYTKDPFWLEFRAINSKFCDKIEDNFPEATQRGYDLYVELRRLLHRGSKVPLSGRN